MKSTLLILPYLVRDTIHRWLMRISSPLARLFVVLFLSFCGLIFLSSYVISVKVLRDRIRSSGADLVVASEYVQAQKALPERGPCIIPQRPEEYLLYHLRESFASAKCGQHFISLVEYPPVMTGLFPGGARQNGLYLLPQRSDTYRGPVEVSIEEHRTTAQSLADADVPLLRKLYPGGALFLPTGSLPFIWQNGYMNKYVLRVQHATADRVDVWEQMLRQLSRLDKTNMNILASTGLLRELHQLETIQYRFRVWVTIGISAIICLLLTSISSLEFRQSEYIYALIGSFGINRFLLYLSFIAENVVLVATGFCGALAGLWGVRGYITETLYKSPGITLTLWELEDDIRTFLLAFGICVLVSSVPILFAIFRPIGNVLK